MPDLLTPADAGRRVAEMNATMAQLVATDPELALPFRQVRHFMTALLYSLEAAEEVTKLQAVRLGELEVEVARLSGRELI
jgi:hypothetical protein